MIWDMTLDTLFWLSTSVYLPDEHGLIEEINY